MPLPPIPPEESCDLTQEAPAGKGPVKCSPTEIELDQEMLEMLSPEDRKLIQQLDMDGSGKCELAEMLGLLRHHANQKGQMGKMMKTFAVVIAILMALLGVNTAVTAMVVEMTKESKTKGDSMTSAATGAVVDTQNSDMGTDASGKLKPKKTVNNSRRLAASENIKTKPSLKSVELASSLPDKTLMSIEEITVYSDKGHTLQIKVAGFSRVPVLNSKCGNVANFYTAWKGIVTLDSKDMSFDDATAKEFKNAGFSLAVGGYQGRRLAGKSKVDTFFKSLENVKKSGKWKCAGVPLPSLTDENQHVDTIYLPCGAETADKVKPDQCDSRFGGLVPAAGFLPTVHATATKSKTAQIRALLNKDTPKIIYVKTGAEVYRSKNYQLTINTYKNNVGMEEVNVYDRTAKKTASFQIYGKEKRSHCTTSTDDASKSVDKAKDDKSVDTDMHFEYIDMTQEDGKEYRHFRMMTADSFNKFMGEGGTKKKDDYTEYWDYADTMTPYRIISGDGSVTIFESLKSSCSDDDIQKVLSARNLGSLAEMMTCSEQEKKNEGGRPPIYGPYSDLDAVGIGYYTDKIFGNIEAAKEFARDDEDKTDKANLARYIVKSLNRLAMYDYCYKKCKEAMDDLKLESNKGLNTCSTGTMTSALKCMEMSGSSHCQNSEFNTNHYEECTDGVAVSDGNKTANDQMDTDPVQTKDNGDRRLEDDSWSGQEVLVPLSTLPDGTHEADLSKTTGQFRAALAKNLGGASTSAKLLFNATSDSTTVHLNSPVESQSRRSVLSGRCLSKYFWVMWTGDGWCMAFEFDPNGFELSIKWGWISGYMGISITCEACVNLLLIWGIPPPVCIDFCVGGNLWVTAMRSCPYIGISAGGKVYWRLAVVAKFWILSITFGSFEIGISASISYFDKNTGHCWWVGSAGRRRRRWWSRRRRVWRRCNYRKECDLKVSAYAKLQWSTMQFIVSENYFVRHRCMTIDIGIYIFEFWKLWWGKWRKVYYTEVARYYFR